MSVDNIVKVFGEARNKMTDEHFLSSFEWYYSVNALCRAEMPHSFETFAGIIAALSPRLSWEKNVEYAHLVLSGANKIPCLTGNANKAIAIRNGADPLDILGGLKVRSFYDNIVNPMHSESVTIDSHAAAIAFDDYSYEFKSGVRLYHSLSDDYRAAAEMLGYRPLEIQSITWEYWRLLHRYKKK